MKVILVQDCPPLGFASERVSVKPGFADRHLFKQGLAVQDFPGRFERLFPEVNQAEIEEKRNAFHIYHTLDTFKRKEFSLKLDPSKFNPEILKTKLKIEDIVEWANTTFDLTTTPEQIKITENLSTFGLKTILVRNYVFANSNREVEFEIRVNLKPKLKLGPSKKKQEPSK